MKLKIPPAFQVLFFSFLMWLIKRITKQSHFDFNYQNEISKGVFLIGILIGVIAVYSFRKAKTTVDPLNPNNVSNLVIKGLYKFTRNPMYIAMLFVLLAILIRLGSIYNFLIIALYIWFITKFQIKPEEQALESIFGNDYLKYKSKVRRWI